MSRPTKATRGIARACALAGAATAALVVPADASDPVTTGPSSSQAPYVVPVAPGVRTISILTVGDAIDDYALVGKPDGMGVLADDEGGFRLFLNHELRPDQGIERTHGGTAGAFVSEWSIDADTLAVTAGRDLIETAWFWTGTGYETRTGEAANLNRFCSADLPAKKAFWDPKSGTGYNGRLFMDGEEADDEGRAFAHLVTGSGMRESYELPALGNTAWENVVAAPGAGRTTVVVGMDDTNPGQVYVYVGTKQADGTPIERAGLTGGSLYAVARAPATALAMSS